MNIWEAAKKDDVERIQYLLTHQVLPNEIDAKHPNKCAPLHQSALSGSLRATRFLLQKGADPNIKAKNGCTPLHISAQNGHLTVVEELLDWGADVNSTSKDKSTPLLTSARKGHSNIVKSLINADARVNAANQENRTALHWSAHGGHVEIVRCLLDNKARVNACDKDGDTPMDDAVKQHHLEVVKLLSKSKGFDIYKCKNKSEVEGLLNEHCKLTLDEDPRETEPRNPPSSPTRNTHSDELGPEDLYELSQSAGVLKAWKHIMRGLGLNESDIIRISADNNNDLRECICQGFTTWQSMKAKEATRENLCKILRREHLAADAEKLEERR